MHVRVDEAGNRVSAFGVKPLRCLRCVVRVMHRGDQCADEANVRQTLPSGDHVENACVFDDGVKWLSSSCGIQSGTTQIGIS